MARSFPHEVGAQVLLVVVGETVTTTAFGASCSWTMRAPSRLAPLEMPDPEAELGGQLLRHEDGVAVIHRDDRSSSSSFMMAG